MKKSVVLIVDDNEVNCDICKIILEQRDVSVHTAENGETGLIKAEKLHPDLILLDIMMPVMDGFEMLCRLKADPELKDIPVLMLTARGAVEDVVKALEMGASDYLKKPFDDAEMAARAKILLNNRQMTKKIAEDLKSGAVMQKKFLTGIKELKHVFDKTGMDVCVFNRSYAAVSGDFFYPKQIDTGSAGLFLGDSCGHGLSAALISMRIIGLVQSIPLSSGSPKEYLADISKDIIDVLPQGRYISGNYTIFNENGFVLSNAGQPKPFFMSGKKIIELEITGHPLGIMPKPEFDEIELEIQSGDRLILYSDGITGAVNESGEHFGAERLFNCLEKNYACSAGLLNDKIIETILLFTGNAPACDDMTMIILEKR